jgi:hypothetical protein
MTEPGPPAGGQMPSDSMDLVTEARSLRRRLVFWRRTAWLALGIAGIVLLLMWQRGQQHQRSCRQSLEGHFREAQRRDLKRFPPELLEQEWRQMPPTGGEVLSAHHYNLIVRNWHTTPVPGEPLPMVVCDAPHAAIPFGRRNVLFYDGQTVTVQWLTESAAEPIIQAALRDDHP